MPVDLCVKQFSLIGETRMKAEYQEAIAEVQVRKNGGLDQGSSSGDGKI